VKLITQLHIASKLRMLELHLLHMSSPVTVAERSEACTVFAHSEAGIVDSNPTQGTDVWYVFVFILCLGRGLASS
jgi:hypothetical protein